MIDKKWAFVVKKSKNPAIHFKIFDFSDLQEIDNGTKR